MRYIVKTIILKLIAIVAFVVVTRMLYKLEKLSPKGMFIYELVTIGLKLLLITFIVWFMWFLFFAPDGYMGLERSETWKNSIFGK